MEGSTGSATVYDVPDDDRRIGLRPRERDFELVLGLEVDELAADRPLADHGAVYHADVWAEDRRKSVHDFHDAIRQPHPSWQAKEVRRVDQVDLVSLEAEGPRD